MADDERRSCSYDYKDPQKRSKGKAANGTIVFKTGFRNCIYEAFKRRGWKETTADLDWDIFWCERDWMHEFFDHVHLETWQRVNHYRNCRELCRKDLLVKNLKRQKKMLIKEKRTREAELYDFWPTTYVLPGDYALFAEEFKRNQGGAWIMKPVGRAQGKGIFLFQKLNQISQWKSEHRWKPGNPEVESYVVQRYIPNPYLVAGKKFDLRLYALVTTYAPLTVFLYRSGFARFTNIRYSADPADLGNSFMHLTNVAIQKTSDNYDKDTGQKWDVRQLKLYLMSKHGVGPVDKLFNEMQMIMLRSLLSVQPVMINDKHCFELYGYDIMLDDNLKPWLIEVNASPSLTASTAADNEMKVTMLTSMLDIIDMEKKNEGIRHQVGGFDLIYHNGAMVLDPSSAYSTFLGADLPRADTRKRSAGASATAKSSNANDGDSKGRTNRKASGGTGTSNSAGGGSIRSGAAAAGSGARAARGTRKTDRYGQRNSSRNQRSKAGDDGGE
jgi:tubulin polyglutamylase TTLL9